jgi:preprotein translocase subunit SecF
MQILRTDTNYDFMGTFRLFGGLSAAAVILSLILVVYPGLNYGIEFSGGTQLQLQFGRGIDSARIRAALSKAGYRDADVVQFGGGSGQNTYLLTVRQTSSISQQVQDRAKQTVTSTFASQGAIEESFHISDSGDRLQVRFGEDIDAAQFEKVLRGAGLPVREHHDGEHTGIVSEAAQGTGASEVCDAPICRLLPLNEFKYEANLVGVSDLVLEGLREDLGASNVSAPERVIYVGPKVGRELTESAILSLVYAILGIMVYVAFRFDLRFAPGGVIALIHDAIITVGFFVATQQQFSLPIVAALLTIVGYSINDTVVIYDRIREVMQKNRSGELSLVINQAINETLSRTIVTSLATLFTIFAIFVLGNGVIRDFAFALIIGIVVGTYSSIFIASPITVYLDRVFRRRAAAA